MSQKLDFCKLRVVLDELYRDLLARPRAASAGISRGALARRVLHFAQSGEADPHKIKTLTMEAYDGPLLRWTSSSRPRSILVADLDLCEVQAITGTCVDRRHFCSMDA